MSEGKKAVLLLVHGSKDPAWLSPFQELKQKLAARVPELMVGLACLQFSPPGIEEELSRLAEQGACRVVIAPLFISSRGHVLKDVPGAVERARSRFPGLKIEVSSAVGETEEVREAMLEALVRLAETGW